MDVEITNGPAGRKPGIKKRGNSAQRDKNSILTEVKKMLRMMHFNQKDIPTYVRREGAWADMRHAALNMIRLFCKARSNQDMRLMYIDDMIGEAGVMAAMFDNMIDEGILTDDMKLKIARHLERIDTDVMSWYSYTRKSRSNESSRVEVGGTC